ncbi:pyocin activator PrtN family protein [Pseudomonas sp. S9]|uniref:pyocin activator PrtN family protein n=1 Tax=Pseudomonas sp. S9 TaxID=686578 RepID=UPI0002556FE2|nr:pyocin activator PrtN family protein [Pseudomonas sp. S9]
MSTQAQRELRLPPAPRSQTVELLHRSLGDVLIPIDQVRTRYFRNLNDENFTRAINTGRVALPITTLDASTKAPKFIDIRHLAIFIDARADAAESELTEQP